MSPPGVSVVVAGPDGAGKTAVATALVGEVLPPPILHLHHRPGLLPARTRHAGPVTEPHREAPYPPWASALKLLYLFADYRLGWWVRGRSIRRSGGSVVIERGWWDLAVDPRRYRMRPPGWLMGVLSRLAPRADLIVVLVSDPEVLHARKAELPVEELDRQVQAWRAFAASRPEALLMDAAVPLAAVVEAVRRRLLGE